MCISFPDTLARTHHLVPVSANKHTPFMRASALQSRSRNCSPAPDMVL